MTQASGTAGQQDPRALRRVAMTSLVGTSIEWYDFFLYGTAAALVFPAVFFPASMPPMVALFASFSTFAIGFFARPLGGILFGNLGDRRGRKRALVIALLMMAASTTLIGLLPGYGTIGWLAPVLLVVLRFVQGLAIGGQWAGAVLLVTENAPAHRRGFYGSFAQIGVPVGVVLANCAFLLVSAVTTPEDFLAFAWRLPFIASVVLIGVALYAQFRLEDTAAFKQLQTADSPATAQRADHPATTVAAARPPVLQALRQYPRQILLAAGAFVGVQVGFYICIAFIVAYGSGPGGLGLSRSTMLTAVLIGAVAMIPALLFFSALSDRYGRRKLYLLGAALTGLWSFALFPMVETRSLLWMTVGLATANVFGAMMYGPQAALLSEMFETKVRYSGATLGYQVGSIVGGGLAPSIATAIFAQTQGSFWIAVYMASMCA
ncbi:MAG: MFS transporter, partial [Gammaproteobacteria bacterium]